jgi:hypothetical protein
LNDFSIKISILPFSKTCFSHPILRQIQKFKILHESTLSEDKKLYQKKISNFFGSCPKMELLRFSTEICRKTMDLSNKILLDEREMQFRRFPSTHVTTWELYDFKKEKKILLTKLKFSPFSVILILRQN